MFDYNGRKYITISNWFQNTGNIFVQKMKMFDCPSFENGKLRVKIPFRYRRPICKVKGITPCSFI